MLIYDDARGVPFLIGKQIGLYCQHFHLATGFICIFSRHFVSANFRSIIFDTSIFLGFVRKLSPTNCFFAIRWTLQNRCRVHFGLAVLPTYLHICLMYVCTLGWSDLALLCDFWKAMYTFMLVRYIFMRLILKNRQISPRARRKFSFSKSRRDLKYEFFFILQNPF